MNIKLILQGLATFIITLTLFMIFPIIWALFYKEYHMLRYFLTPLILVIVIFVPLLLGIYFYDKRQEIKKLMTVRTGLLLVVISWLSAAAIAAMPFYFSGNTVSYIAAYFEAMSGFTTTGASILEDIELLPKSLLFWRSLTHWLGGMGIIVLTVALFPILGINGLQLMKAEAPGPNVDRLTSRISSTALILWSIYLSMTILQSILLMLGGMSLYEALNHSFATLATGGFSTRSLSVGAFDSAYIDIVISVFMVLAGVNFIIYFSLLTGKFSNIKNNSELKLYLGILVLSTLLIAFILFRKNIYENFAVALRYASFQVASILSTTGFVTTDYDSLWPNSAKIILFSLMFIGGSAGSTAGGIKVVRLLVIWRKSIIEILYLLNPKNVYRIKLNGKGIGNLTASPIFGFFILYLLLLFITTIVVGLNGYSISTAVSTALATLGNIGPGFSRVGPALNYAHFSDSLLLFLSLIMLIGRLEIFTVVVLFTKQFWTRF